MALGNSTSLDHMWRVALALGAFLCALAAGLNLARAQLLPEPLTVAVHVSSDRDRCYAPGLVAAIRHFTSDFAEGVNRNGGIKGRPLTVRYFDDFEDSGRTVENVRAALADESLVAMLGVSSSTRGRAVFAELGDTIRKSDVPFITEMSVDRIFNRHRNVFTMASSVRNELEAVGRTIVELGAKRPVFVGLDDDRYSFALEEGIAMQPGVPVLADRLRIPVENYKISEVLAAGTAAKIKALSPDLIVLSIYSGPSARLLGELGKLGVRVPAVVLLGRISTISRKAEAEPFRGRLYQIARDGVPNVVSERLRNRIWRQPQARWLFPDVPNDETPGWASGDCKTDETRAPLQIFDGSNQRAIARGTQYRDMLALIVEAARSAKGPAELGRLRAHIGDRLRSFTHGREVLRGLWQDWAFTDARTAAVNTLLLQKDAGDPSIALAPRQFQRVAGRLQPTTTLFTSIDLIRLSQISTNEQSFDAEFYLTLRSENDALNVDDIEFTNAVRSPTTKGKLLSIREIHSGKGSSDFPSGVRLYRVSGRFLFEPELRRYPFDTQRFSVSFQAASTEKAFLVQPSADPAGRARGASDGWRIVDAYVGSDQDIIPTIGTSLSEQRIVPFYRFNVTWVASRIAVDYYTRVIIPLGFILLITYFSVFLPHTRFESAMGIQVTALLSAIALYLALPKIDTDQATLSDRIFTMTYAAVAAMIGLSILKDNMRAEGGSALRTAVIGVQRVVFPIAILAAFAWVLKVGFGDLAAFAERVGLRV
ncbi:MAG: ABC transporter substrate-binding protein [Pseudomonadota bacterium]